MPLSDTYTRLPISSITVNRSDRQRSTIDVGDLQKSIRQIGLINPIIVRHHYDIHKDENTYVLVAGERRLEACRTLGWSDVPVRFAEDLSPTESLIIELEENVKRQDLDWRDNHRAIARIHALHLSLDPEWTAAETADSLSITPGHISRVLRVFAELDDPRISGCATGNEAYNVITRRDQRRMSDSLADLLEEPTHELRPITGDPVLELITVSSMPYTVGTSIVDKESQEEGGSNRDGDRMDRAPSMYTGEESADGRGGDTDPALSVLNESFLEWAPQYVGPKFNFIHCDFPFGISHAEGNQGRGSEHTSYTDDEDTFFRLLNCFIDNFDRFASISCHVMFWYSAKLWPELKLKLYSELSSVDWVIHPLIWLRTDNSGVSPNPRRLPRHIYETCLFGSRGNRNLVRVAADAYASPGDRTLHPHTKPEPMLRHFFQMTCDEHTALLDPTCGSGSALRAAESLGAPIAVGIETNWEYCEAARKALRDARRLRKLSRT